MKGQGTVVLKREPVVFDSAQYTEWDFQKVKKLWSAVLIRAILDFHGHAVDCEWADPHMDARKWLTSQCRETASYLWICELLDLEHRPLLVKIMKLKKVSHLKRFYNTNYTFQMSQRVDFSSFL